MSLRRGGWAGVLWFIHPIALAAQSLIEPGATTGVEVMRYSFGPYFGVRSITQVAIPVTAALTTGRLSLDVGTYYASTRLESSDSLKLVTVSGFTDTQVRGAVVLGQDALVLTAVLNVPTGRDRLTLPENAVVAATSSSFLRFPVNSYASGPGITAGIAGARTNGSWNLGAAASLRYSGEYVPIVSGDEEFEYRAGLEGRLRLGADRLIGSSRLSLGLTFSGFSNDTYGPGGVSSGQYRPGKRFILEASYTRAISEMTATGYLWDFFRTRGDSAGTAVANQENVLGVGALVLVPLRRTVTWEPQAELRLTSPEDGSGIVLDLVSTVRVRLSNAWSVVPAIRAGFGRIEQADPGFGHQLRGLGFSVFLRGTP